MASPVAHLDLREKQVKLDHLNVNFLKGPRVHWKYDIGPANRPQTFCLYLPIFLLIGEVKWGRKYPGIMSGCLIETYIIGSQRRSDIRCGNGEDSGGKQKGRHLCFLLQSQLVDIWKVPRPTVGTY